MRQDTARMVASELQLTGAGPRGIIRFHGTSMAPFLRDGDDVVLAPVAWPEIRAGDVVTFRLADRFPTYRVVRRHAARLHLRGDGWPERDFRAWPEDVLGRAIARGREGRWLAREDPRWRLWSWLALARYRADTGRRRLRRALGQGYRSLRDRLRGAAPVIVIDGTRPGSPPIAEPLRDLDATTPAARIEVRLTSAQLTTDLADELVRRGVARVVVLAGAEASAAVRGAAAVTTRRRARAARVPIVRVECPLDGEAYAALGETVRGAAVAGVHELGLTGRAAAAVIAGDGGARLKEAVKLAEALRIRLDGPVPVSGSAAKAEGDLLSEILR
jgi:hypothetical protein